MSKPTIEMSATELLEYFETNIKARAESGEKVIFKDEFAARIRQSAIDILAERKADEQVIQDTLKQSIQATSTEE